jgi:hypothetical protein
VRQFANIFNVLKLLYATGKGAGFSGEPQMVYEYNARVSYKQSMVIANYIRERDVVEEGTIRFLNSPHYVHIIQFVRGITEGGRELEVRWGSLRDTTDAYFEARFPDGSKRLARDVARELISVGLEEVEVWMKNATLRKHFDIFPDEASMSKKLRVSLPLVHIIRVLNKNI